MINPFIKLTGTDGYGNERMLHLNVNQICGYYIDTRGHNTKIVSGAEIFCAIETPEEISAMIQKYYDEKMRMDFIQSVLTGICANITVNDMTTDHRSLCIDAVQIGNAMMEVLKND